MSVTRDVTVVNKYSKLSACYSGYFISLKIVSAEQRGLLVMKIETSETSQHTFMK